MILGNRAINLHKVDKIIKEIEAGNDMLQYYPIQVRVVKDKLEILDGQHRFFISKKLKRPVYYILVSEKKSMHDIARINSNVETWKDDHFINCYTTEGNLHYKELKEFHDKYKFSIGICLSLLHLGSPGDANGSNAKLRSNFEEGKFEVLKKKEAIEVAEMVKQFDSFGNWRGRTFILALYRIKKAGKVSIEDVLQAYRKNPEMLTKQAHYKEYIIKLEYIINQGKHKRIVIT
jgi:hypothetical protein